VVETAAAKKRAAAKVTAAKGDLYKKVVGDHLSII
jgi:hypothetical protein